MSECIEWQKAKNAAGYGVRWDPVARKTRLAHRVAIGALDGEVVLHLCDNPSCVNPEHLRRGTHAENKADCIRKNRDNIGERNGHAKLSDELAQWIRESPQTNTQLARALGVSQPAISMIRSGKRRERSKHASCKPNY